MLQCPYLAFVEEVAIDFSTRRLKMYFALATQTFLVGWQTELLISDG